MIKAIIVLASCVLSLELIPAIGGLNYALLGLVFGLVAVFVVAYDGQHERPRFGIKARYSLIVGALVGLFWPGAVIVFGINGGGMKRD